MNSKKHDANMLQNLLRAQEGLALIEFAIMLPVLLLLMIPLYDFHNYINTEQKVIKTGWVIADMIGMSATQQTLDDEKIIPRSMLLTRASLSSMLETSHFLMTPKPIDAASNFRIRAASIQKMPDDSIRVHWLAEYNGEQMQVYRNPGANAMVLPNNFAAQMVRGENLIATEVSYSVRPLLSGLASIGISLNDKRITKTQYFPVRYGSLTTIQP